MISTILKFIGIILFGVIAVAFVLVFGTWFLVALFSMMVLFGLAWAVGIPITITSNGKKIGYIRWTKFYPTK